MKIDLTDKQPFYMQVRQTLKTKIETNEWKEGDLIPSEKELSESFGVSRVTIRKAISQLVSEKYLTRRAGYGTTVLRNTSSLSSFTLIQSFTNEMNEMGLAASTLDAHLKLIQADNKLADIFKIKEGDPLYNLQRVRGPKQPILYSDTYLLPIIEIPNTDEFLFGSLYEYLASQNIYFNMFEEFVSAQMAPKMIRNKLQIYDDNPQLIRKRFSYDQSNKLIEYTITYYNANNYEYRTRIFYRRK